MHIGQNECVNTEENIVCAPKPWLDLAIKVGSGVRGSVKLVSKLSFYRRILLMLLKLEPYECSENTITWAVINNGDTTVEVKLSEQDWYTLYSHRLPKLIALALAEPLKVALFMAIGASGILINLSAAVVTHNFLLPSFGWISKPLASSVGFELSVTWNFLLHERITFRDRNLAKILKERVVRFAKYHVASVASYFSQVSIATLMPVLLGLPFWLAQLVGIITGFIANFILGYAYTWSMHMLRGDVYGVKT